MDQIWQETLPALEEQKQKGIIGAYGLSGKPLICIDYVARKYGYDKISTILTYCQYNLTDESLNHFMPRLKKYDIGIMQGGVTAMGLLTPQGPPSWHPASDSLKQKCLEGIEIVKEKTKGNDKQKDMAILRLSFLHGMENKALHTILVGPTNTKQLENNINWVKEGINDSGYLNDDDKELIEYLQYNVFADIMNLGWIEDGTQYNICEATFESSHWKDVLHYHHP